MKNLFLCTALASLLSVSGFAQQEKPAPKEKPCSPKKEHCPKPLRVPIPLYEVYSNDGINIGARGDILYMVYNAPVLTFASEQTTINQALHSTILNVPGKLSLGCNVALMYTMCSQPGYSFETGWYHIVAKFARHDVASNLLPAHMASLALATAGTADVNAHVAINLFDLMIKKDFSFGDWVSMTPAAGLVGGYMNGKNKANFVATSGAFSNTTHPTGTLVASTLATLDYTTHFEGVGLKLGGCTSFKIWQGLKLKADFFYNVMYGVAKAHLSFTENGNFAGLNAAVSDFTQHHARAFFDSLLGVAWETTFCKDSMYVDLHAGWRFQTFSDGWKEFEAEFNDALHELALSGQGLQAGATFRF